MNTTSRTILTLAGASLLCFPIPQAFAQQQPKPPARVRARLDGFELSPQAGKSANQVGGASRDLGSPRLFVPNSGKAFSLTPAFYWGTSDVGGKVTFRLTSMDGQTLYETSTTTSHLTYPADAPTLEPGKSYRWTVLPENDVLGGAPRPATVMIVSGPEREAIQKELAAASQPDARSMVFVNHRIWYDAVDSYTLTLDQMPDDQAARSGRATLYDQMPVTKELAEADWRMVH